LIANLQNQLTRMAAHSICFQQQAGLDKNKKTFCPRGRKVNLPRYHLTSPAIRPVRSTGYATCWCCNGHSRAVLLFLSKFLRQLHQTTSVPVPCGGSQPAAFLLCQVPL